MGKPSLPMTDGYHQFSVVIFAAAAIRLAGKLFKSYITAVLTNFASKAYVTWFLTGKTNNLGWNNMIGFLNEEDRHRWVRPRYVKRLFHTSLHYCCTITN